MRPLVIVLLGLCGCARVPAPTVSEQAPPSVWIEARPSVEPDANVDASAWTGEWTEYFPGRGVCQDRFTLSARGPTIGVSSIDCGSERPYTISAVRFDGETLSFVAEGPNGAMTLRYAVRLDGPEQISGTANGVPITWSRTR